MDLTGIECEDMDLVYLAQDIRIFMFHEWRVNFFNNKATACFINTVLLHVVSWLMYTPTAS
jgi:hypothetical protein